MRKFDCEIWDYNKSIHLGILEADPSQPFIPQVVALAVKLFGSEQSVLDHYREVCDPCHTFNTVKDLLLYAGEWSEIWS